MRIIQIAAVFATLFMLASCEKEIKVNVNSSEPTVVIAGDITDAPGPYTVRISRSIQLDETTAYPSVPALVYVTDNLGNTDTFNEKSAGLYQSSTLAGVVGRIYTLHVITDGSHFTASSTMPAPVPFDSLVIATQTAFKDTAFYPQLRFTDPPGVPNYYRFVEQVNGKPVTSIFVRSDRLSDGKRAEVTLRDNDFKLEPGDIATVEMQCIDKATYDYFNTLRDADGSSNSAAPADPVSNLTGGALGYFSAHTSAIKSVKR